MSVGCFVNQLYCSYWLIDRVEMGCEVGRGTFNDSKNCNRGRRDMLIKHVRRLGGMYRMATEIFD